MEKVHPEARKKLHGMRPKGPPLEKVHPEERKRLHGMRSKGLPMEKVHPEAGKRHHGMRPKGLPIVKSKIVCKFFQVQSKSGSGFHGCSVKRTCLSVEIFAVLQAKIQPLAS